jgi:hypothetical protein
MSMSVDGCETMMQEFAQVGSLQKALDASVMLLVEKANL